MGKGPRPAAFLAHSRMESTQVTTVFVNRPWIAALATAMAVLAIDGTTEFDYFSLS